MQILPQNTQNFIQNFDETYSQNSYAQQQSIITDTLSISKRKKTGKWSDEEDQLLRQMVHDIGEKSWKKISEKMHGRSAIQCIHRWTKILKPGLVKGSWSKEEDELLQQWVTKNGPYNWAQVSQIIQGRSGKQCRERWFNNLNPNVKKGNWTAEEDQIIFQQYQIYSSSWSKIAQALPGRTENSIKNRFYSTIRKITMEKEKTQSNNLSAAKQIGLEQTSGVEEHCSADLNAIIRKQIKITDDSKSSYEDTQMSHNDEIIDFEKEITDFHDIFSEPEMENLENYGISFTNSNSNSNTSNSNNTSSASKANSNTNSNCQQQSNIVSSRKDNRYNNKLYKLLSNSSLNLPQQPSLSVNGMLMRKNQKKYNYKQKIMEKKQQQNILKKNQIFKEFQENGYEVEEQEVLLPIAQCNNNQSQNLMSQQKFDSLLHNIEKTLDQELDIVNLNNPVNNIDKLQNQIFEFCNQTKIDFADDYDIQQQYSSLIPSTSSATTTLATTYQNTHFNQLQNQNQNQSEQQMNLFDSKYLSANNTSQNIIEQIKITQDLYESSQNQLAQIQDSGQNNKMINFLINSLQTLENLLINTKEEIQKIEFKQTSNSNDQEPSLQQQKEQFQISQQYNINNNLSNEFNINNNTNENCKQQLSEQSKQLQQKLLEELEQIDEDDYENEFNDLHSDNFILELLNKQNLLNNYEQQQQHLLFEQNNNNNHNENLLQNFDQNNNLLNNFQQNLNNIGNNLFDFDNDKYFMTSDNQHDIDQFPFVLDL